MTAKPITASRTIAATPEVLFTLLLDGSNHWTLGGRRMVLLALDRDRSDPLGGYVQVRGPLGLRRTARTRVTELTRPHGLAGVAHLESGTRAEVRWRLEPEGDGTRVTLVAEVRHAHRIDRLLLAVGGRLWMRGAFGVALRRLEARVAQDALGAPAAYAPAP